MSDEQEAPITMSEVVSAGQCAKGQRRWLNERMPGWKQYVKTGMPIEVARSLNPALVELVLKLREARRGQET